MVFFKHFSKYLDIGLDILEVISYSISFILIFFSVIMSVYKYIIDYIDPNIDELTAFKRTRLNLAEAASLSLAFLLGVQILKLFHIQTYKQLLIVIALVAIKFMIAYNLNNEILSYKKDIRI